MGILSIVPFPVSVLNLRADYSGVIICLLARIMLAAAVDNSQLRTDQNGWIQLSTDGEQLSVEAERK
jgi:hypothetical protein